MKRFTGRLLKSMAAFVLVLILAAAPVAASAASAWINSSSAKVYASNGKSGKLPKGTSVNFTGVSGGWAKIKYKGVSGIVKLKYITLKSGITGYAKVNTALYRSASSSSSKKGTIPKGTKLKVVGINGNYLQVADTSYSVTGYVRGSNVSKTKPSTASGSSSSAASYTRAERVVILAKAQIGKPYAYGAEGSSRFDCSGLCYYVYKYAAGITLPRASSSQASDGRFSTIRSLSSLKAGDLVCFNTGSGSGVDHVGIYIGGGKFIHASDNAGKVLQSEFDSYYRGAFLWAKRIV